MADSDKQGTQGEAKPEGSVAESNQGSSQSDAVTVEQFNQLQNQIEALRRSLQSEKDKGVKKLGERLDNLEGDLKSVLQVAAKEGRSASDVLETLREQEEAEAREAMLEMARAFRGGQLSTGSVTGTQRQDGVKAHEVVRDLELDVEDVRVKEFMSRTFTSPQEAYREAVKLTKSILRQPKDADRASTPSDRQGAIPNQDKLMQEYREGSKNLYGRNLIAFKKQMREKGLDIT